MIYKFNSLKRIATSKKRFSQIHEVKILENCKSYHSSIPILIETIKD